MRFLAVTRPQGRGVETAEFIRQLGWNPLIVHTVELRPRDPLGVFAEVRTILSEGALDWLIFMSPEGVQLLFDILRTHSNLLPSILGRLRIVAVGPRTREAVLKQGVRDVSIPDNYSSDGVAAFLSTSPLDGKRVVLARSSEANDSLATTLTSKGAKVTTTRLYSSSAPDDRSTVETFVEELKHGTVGGVLFTSSQSATNLFKMAEDEIAPPELAGLLRNCLVGAIGPTTAKKLRDLGIQPDIVPTRYLINEAARAIVETWEARKVSAMAGFTS